MCFESSINESVLNDRDYRGPLWQFISQNKLESQGFYINDITEMKASKYSTYVNDKYNVLIQPAAQEL